MPGWAVPSVASLDADKVTMELKCKTVSVYLPYMLIGEPLVKGQVAAKKKAAKVNLFIWFMVLNMNAVSTSVQDERMTKDTILCRAPLEMERTMQQLDADMKKKLKKAAPKKDKSKTLNTSAWKHLLS